MEAQKTLTDLRALIVIVLENFPKSDKCYQLAQQIATRHGMVELLTDRVGEYEGGDG